MQKIILNTSVNNFAVIKQVKSNAINVYVVKNGKKAKGYHQITFTDNEQYLLWLDAIVSDEIAIYNTALGVSLLLNELEV